MQMCPECGRVYDESEYSKCPYCKGFFFIKKNYHIVYDYEKEESVDKDKANY